MLVVIKSAPDSPQARQGVTLAKDISADIVLLQNGVYLSNSDSLDGFTRNIYILDDDLRLRGITAVEKAGEVIKFDRLVELMATDDKVIGMF